MKLPRQYAEFMTPEQAGQVRHWRLEEGRTHREIAGMAEDAGWPVDDSQFSGSLLCSDASRLLDVPIDLIYPG